ncbi:MAG: DUF3352 domain-containing protein [Rhodopirellula sp.]|nr:DUF3352 domain-containing protein [Rhodopirellula sp.]
MLRNKFSLLAAALPLILAGFALAGEPLPPATHWIPQQAVLSIELTNPKPLFDRVMDPAVVKAVEESPVYREQAEKKGVRDFLGGVQFLEASLGTSWQEAVRKLAGRGVTFAMWPDNKVAIIIDGEDAALLARFHEIAVSIAKGEAEKSGNAQRVASADYRGVTGWTFNGEEAHAILGTRAIVTNNSKALKAVIDLCKDGDGSSLAKAASYQAAKKAAGTANAMAYVDLATLKQLPPFQKALKGSENPLLSLLLSGVLDSLRTSNWLAVGATVEGKQVAFSATTDGKATTEMASFAQPDSPEKGILPNLDVPRRIAAVSLYRDLHGFYAAKDELFPERTSGLIFFENMMGIFFSGRDLTDEVLAETEPEVRLVVANQDYDSEVGTPKVQIPAFALVLRMAHPEKFALIAEEGWQKALGLVNFTRGQQGLPGLIIDRPEHGGVKYSIAYFSTVDVKDKTDLETRFNFRPALARVNDYLVISSTDALTKDIIEALQKGASADAKPAAGTHSLAEVDTSSIAAILSANRENLVRNNMVEKGKTREEAESETGGLIALLQYLGEATLKIGSQDGLTRATLDLEPKLP